MAKCVGITADVTTDKWDLERGYPTMFNWQIVSSDLTYDEAQKIKLEYKAKGYENHPRRRGCKRTSLFCLHF